MKTKSILLITLMVLSTSLFAKKTDPVPEIVLIGIGAKNPTFNEAQYPDIKFYYTPELVSQAKVGGAMKSALALTGAARETFAGEPKFLADANEDHELNYSFLVFDKNGVCFSQGYKIGQRRSGLMKTVGVDKKSLEDTFKELLKKEKVAKVSKKEMKLKKSDFMLGYKMPEYNIADVNGNAVTINSITAGGKPVMIVFFQLPSDIDIQEAKKSGKGKSGKAFGKALFAGAAGATVTSLCENIESEFFGYDAREK
jgi:hypothetical protein